MMLFAQIDQAADVVTRATEAGWEFGLIVVIILGAFALLGVLVRSDRAELREINRFVRTEMPDVIDGNTILMARFMVRLQAVPCLLHDSDFDKLGEGNGARLSEQEVAELDEAAKKAVVRVKRRVLRRAKSEEDSGGA